MPEAVMRGDVIAGAGVKVTQTNLGFVVELDTAAVQGLIDTAVAAALKASPGTGTGTGVTVIKGSRVLDFGPITDGSCSIDMNFPLPGVVVGDALAPVWPDMEAGLIGQMRVMGPGMIAVRLCNHSGKEILDPGPLTFGAAVVR